jgi:predicted RNA binding protein YcfA (HicA-like mRNA interferase family)
MPSLPSVTGDEVVAAFSQIGFSVVRVKGSHHIMKKEGYRTVLSVPVHGARKVKPGTLRSLIQDAGISVDEFVALLR